MAKDQVPNKPAFYGYPIPKKCLDTEYVNKPGSNPVIRGIPLEIAGWALATFKHLASFLWSNAGFSKLRDYSELHDFEPRYDPTVIPLGTKTSGTEQLNVESRLNDLVEKRIGQPPNPNRHHSVADYHYLYSRGKLTPTAVAQALLKLINGSEEHKVAFITIKEDKVLAAAEASTQRWQAGKARSALDGVPVAVKDEVDLYGYEKSLGSRDDFTRQGGGTSWCVRKWEEAGAVIIGKLNMHEFGLDTTNNNPIKGTPLNPHNPNYYTGGSSGGSAYAVSAGLVPITLGADGGGSIRIPSSFCGIYGLKPSHGRVSGSPTSNLASSCGVLGPLASNMADLEIAYRIMATPDPSHPSSSLFPHPTPTPCTNLKVLGVFAPWFDSANATVHTICSSALDRYRDVGYEIIPITLPHLPFGQLAHTLTILSEISNGAIPSLSKLTPANKILFAVGRQTPATDFLLAQKMRQLLMRHLAHLFRTHPGMLIVTPTSPILGWPIMRGATDLARGCSDANMSLRNMEYVWLANFTGCPAISIPIGMGTPRTEDFPGANPGGGKIPVGLMAMAEWGGEESLLEWGRVTEEWAWKDDEGSEFWGRMKRAGTWVDVLDAATKVEG